MSAAVTSEVLLSIDFGTSSTTAALRWPDGRTAPVLFDGTPVLESSVCLAPDGRLVVGGDARAAARTSPQACEPTPKRCIDDSVVLLADTEFAVEDVIGAVLSRVGDEARRTAGASMAGLVLTYPAGWGQRRRNVLASAAARAGLPEPTLVAEPVAAAAFLTVSSGAQIPDGGTVLVYDLGAGTFDAAVVRRDATGFTVLAATGLDDAGGQAVDATLLGHVGAVCADRDPLSWQRLRAPENATDQRLSRQLWDEARAAKETLTRVTSTTVHVPLLSEDVTIGRAQLEHLARPVLARTITATKAALSDAGVAASDLSGVVLVGGASRIPLVATLLHEALGVVPTISEQPEFAVAHGALVHDRPEPARPGTASAAPPAAGLTTTQPLPAVAGPAGRRAPAWRRLAAGVGAIAACAALVALLLVLVPGGRSGAGDAVSGAFGLGASGGGRGAGSSGHGGVGAPGTSTGTSSGTPGASAGTASGTPDQPGPAGDPAGPTDPGGDTAQPGDGGPADPTTTPARPPTAAPEPVYPALPAPTPYADRLEACTGDVYVPMTRTAGSGTTPPRIYFSTCLTWDRQDSYGLATVGTRTGGASGVTKTAFTLQFLDCATTPTVIKSHDRSGSTRSTTVANSAASNPSTGGMRGRVRVTSITFTEDDGTVWTGTATIGTTACHTPPEAHG